MVRPPTRLDVVVFAGGVFVYFADPAAAEKGRTVLRDNQFNGRTLEVYLVQGTPFLEDLLMMYPSPRLSVDLPAEDIPIEELYAIFRQFGRIHTMTVDKKTAKVMFGSARYAIAGAFCQHPLSQCGTKTAMFRDS
jgi:hypothetical protein